MGLGNKKTYGGKGESHSYEMRSLQLLGILAGAAPPPPGTFATEATLAAVLAAIRDHQDFEIKVVRDTGNSDKIVCEKQTYDETAGTYSFTYEDVGGAAYVPVGPLEYVSSDAALGLILAELITLNAGGQLLTQATFLAEDFATETTLSALNTAFAAEDFATETTLAAINGKLNSLGQKASAGSVPVVLSTEQQALIDGIETLLTSIDTTLGSAATEITLLATNALLTTIDTVLDNILLDTTAILADTNTLSTPVAALAMSVTRATDATGSPIAAGKRRISVMNVGAADGDILGGTNNIKPGESLTFTADGLRDTLAAFAFDGTGTELIITTVG